MLAPVRPRRQRITPGTQQNGRDKISGSGDHGVRREVGAMGLNGSRQKDLQQKGQSSLGASHASRRGKLRFTV